MSLQKQIRKVLLEYWVKPKQDNTDIDYIRMGILKIKFV